MQGNVGGVLMLFCLIAQLGSAHQPRRFQDAAESSAARHRQFGTEVSIGLFLGCVLKVAVALALAFACALAFAAALALGLAVACGGELVLSTQTFSFAQRQALTISWPYLS